MGVHSYSKGATSQIIIGNCIREIVRTWAWLSKRGSIKERVGRQASVVDFLNHATMPEGIAVLYPYVHPSSVEWTCGCREWRRKRNESDAWSKES